MEVPSDGDISREEPSEVRGELAHDDQIQTDQMWEEWKSKWLMDLEEEFKERERKRRDDLGQWSRKEGRRLRQGGSAFWTECSGTLTLALRLQPPMIALQPPLMCFSRLVI